MIQISLTYANKESAARLERAFRELEATVSVTHASMAFEQMTFVVMKSISLRNLRPIIELVDKEKAKFLIHQA